MEDYILKLVFLGAFCWGALFVLVRNLLPWRSFEFCNRLVSTVHATLAVSLACFSVQDWRCPVSPLASRSSPLQMQVLAVTLSYLIYDLLCCLFDKKVILEDSVHHVVSIVGIGAGLAYELSGSEMVACLFLAELSGPFLHLRELVKELGYRDTDINLAADIAFAVTFSVARIIGGPYVTYVTLTADNPLLIKFTSFGLQLVSCFWFYKILRMVNYKLGKRKQTQKSSPGLNPGRSKSGPLITYS